MLTQSTTKKKQLNFQHFNIILANFGTTFFSLADSQVNDDEYIILYHNRVEHRHKSSAVSQIKRTFVRFPNVHVCRSYHQLIITHQFPRTKKKKVKVERTLGRDIFAIQLIECLKKKTQWEYCTWHSNAFIEFDCERLNNQINERPHDELSKL